MKEVKAIVVYPVEVVIQVSETATPDEIWQEVIEAADKEVIGTAPVIHTCSDSELMDKLSEPIPPPDSQEEWIQYVLQSLQKSRALLAPAVSARVLLKPEARPDVLLEIDRALEQEINRLIASVSEVEDPWMDQPWTEEELKVINQALDDKNKGQDF